MNIATMDHDCCRSFPSIGRSVAAIVAAIAAPTALMLSVEGIWKELHGLADVAELAMVLLIYVGQSAVVAITVAMWRWRRMSFPLFECVLLGALLAPGPLGYIFLPFAFSLGVWNGLGTFLMFASFGAVGGFTGWAVATVPGGRAR